MHLHIYIYVNIYIISSFVKKAQEIPTNIFVIIALLDGV